MSERVSVRDVAQEAGVSIGSVSRVLNGNGYASVALRRAVLEAAGRLGYEPDHAARQLRTGHSRAIGYLLPDIANPAQAMHLSAVERLLREAGYSVLIGSSGTPARDAELLQFFENHRLEGVIALPNSEYPDVSTCPFVGSRLPVVLVDRELGHPVDSVLVDHRLGIGQAIEYLVSLGHRRIALFASSIALRPGREKLAGYRAALERAGLAFDEALVYHPDAWLESPRERMAALLQLPSPPTALISIGTHLLSAAVRVARERGLQIPGDLSVVGIGTTEMLELMYPPVTSLRYSFERSAQACVRLLLERISGVASGAARQVMVYPELVVGGSCDRPRPAA
jgi:LacI family transcriptional regulator